MNHYKDRFNDNFSHNRVEVGSRNHFNFTNSPGFTLLIGFGISLFIAITVYLAFVDLLILQILMGVYVGGGTLLLTWLAVNIATRSGAKMFVAIVYYLGQRNRNNVIETDFGPVLDDPMHRYRAAVENREIIKERHYQPSLNAPAGQYDQGNDEPDIDWTQTLQGRRQQMREDRIYEADL